MNRTALSIVLTVEQREMIEQIAKDQYGGSIGQAIRAAMETAYPSMKQLEKVGKAGRRLKPQKVSTVNQGNG